MTTTPGAPCWTDLLTTDADGAATFYSTLFGWTVGEASQEFGGYRMFFRDDQPIAGLMPLPEGPSYWNISLATDDLDTTLAKAAAAGAQIVQPAVPIADMGRSATLIDPTGVVVGAWEAGTFPGFLTRGEVGAPMWFEVLSKDYAISVAFYRDVFGWDVHTMSDSDDFRYATLGENESLLAGIMDASGFLGEDPARWQFYVQVEDTDAAIEQATELGGALIIGPDDTPYGRLATLVDPNGVIFLVSQDTNEGA